PRVRRACALTRRALEIRENAPCLVSLGLEYELLNERAGHARAWRLPHASRDGRIGAFPISGQRAPSGGRCVSSETRLAALRGVRPFGHRRAARRPSRPALSDDSPTESNRRTRATARDRQP